MGRRPKNIPMREFRAMTRDERLTARQGLDHLVAAFMRGDDAEMEISHKALRALLDATETAASVARRAPREDQCCIKHCERPARSRRMCLYHYRRWWQGNREQMRSWT